MTRRIEIGLQIEANIKIIKELQLANEKLTKEDYLISDEKQWFTEKIESIRFRGNRKKGSVDMLVGRVHWYMHFKDEDTGESISIERSKLVRTDGEWEF